MKWVKAIKRAIKGAFREEPGMKVIGHLKIREVDGRDGLMDGLRPEEWPTNQVVLDKANAIHPENFSIMVARGIANRDNGTIYTMHFGAGGATVDPLGVVSYATPNTAGVADLNIPVFFEVVDDADNAPPGNQMSVRHVSGTLFSDIEIRCVLDKNQPFGQPIADSANSTNLNDSNFVFTEIGLKTEDGLLVTHVTFSPLEKSASRVWEINYTIRIRVT